MYRSAQLMSLSSALVFEVVKLGGLGLPKSARNEASWCSRLTGVLENAWGSGRPVSSYISNKLSTDASCLSLDKRFLSPGVSRGEECRRVGDLEGEELPLRLRLAFGNSVREWRTRP
jgi:hypothetical protein